MRACLLLVVAFLVGCASLQRPGTAADIAPDLRFVTPGPQDLDRRVEVLQMITARYGDQVYAFEGRLSASPGRLELIGLDSFGRRAIRIVRTDERVQFDPAPWLPDIVRPENILADIAIAYWPEAAVRQGLAGTPALLRSDSRERSISVGGREIIRVEYGPAGPFGWAESVRYRNFAFGYELDLRSVAVTP